MWQLALRPELQKWQQKIVYSSGFIKHSLKSSGNWFCAYSVYQHCSIQQWECVPGKKKSLVKLRTSLKLYWKFHFQKWENYVLNMLCIVNIVSLRCRLKCRYSSTQFFILLKDRKCLMVLLPSEKIDAVINDLGMCHILNLYSFIHLH